MEHSDCMESTAVEEKPQENENSDLEDGEIEDDDEEIPPPNPPNEEPDTKSQNTALPVTNDAINPVNEPREKRKRSAERKSEKHLTEAEKSVLRYKQERAERERRERLRREQTQDDWAGKVEMSIYNALHKPKHASGSEGEDEEKRDRKRRKKDRARKKKYKKNDSPNKNEELNENEIANFRKDGRSPENKFAKENSPSQGEDSLESEESDYDNTRPGKRTFERDRKSKIRNRESRRDQKNYRDRNRKKDQSDPSRPQIQDANSICMFYMQGKCVKGEECPYSHDALPPMKMELCKFYLMDCCAKRDKCLYMHSEFPCKYYHTGLKCFAKDKCKFAHGKPLSDSLKQVLLKHLETAPKEILGDFPRLSRDGALHMIQQTQQNLEVQYGIKNNSTEKSAIPSLFEIDVPIPPELLQQQQQKQQNFNDSDNNKTKADKVLANEKPKVRHTRWNDEPPIPLSILNQALASNLPGVNNVFNNLTLQDQQKIQEYHLAYQMKGFYNEQDQDMRNNSNGEMDIRSIPPLIPRNDSSFPSGLKFGTDTKKIELDLYSSSSSDPKLSIVEESSKLNPIKNDYYYDNEHFDSKLTIDEKIVDTNSDLPSNLPKKQRELFLRIQAQQKENIPENQHSDQNTPTMNDDDWYSSDDDNGPLSKMVIHLEEEANEEEEEEKKHDEKRESPERILSPPTIKPVEVIDKLGDLSKIDISAEVTKLLTSIKSNSSTISTQEMKKSRDPRQAKLLEQEEIAPASISSSDPRMKPSGIESCPERKNSDPRAGLSIYEQGIIDVEDLPNDSDMSRFAKEPDDIHASFADNQGKQEGDMRNLGLPFKAMQNYTPATEIDASIGSHNPITYKVHVVDIPRPNYTKLKMNATDTQVMADPRLRKIFRVPATPEVEDSPASPLQSPTPKPIRQDPRKRREPVEPSKPDVNTLTYSQKLQLLQSSSYYQNLTSNQKLSLNQKIASDSVTLTGILSSLGLIANLPNPNTCAINILANINSMIPHMSQMMGGNLTPMANMQQNINPNMGNIGAMSNLMPINTNPNQNIPGITPNLGPGLLGAAPGIPLNQSLATNIGPGISQNLGANLCQNLTTNVGQNLGPNLNQNLGPNLVPNVGQNLGPNVGQNLGLAANVGQNLTPNVGQNLTSNVGQNDFQINFNPRNGGLLGTAPFQNFADNQNFQYNDEYYPEENTFPNQAGNSFPIRNERTFRSDRNPQNSNRRGRSWNNRHNARNYNRNNNTHRNRSNRSYSPP